MSLLASMIVCDVHSEDRRRLQAVALSAAALAVLCSMDLWQLVFAAMGAACYISFQTMNSAPRRVKKTMKHMLPPVRAAVKEQRVWKEDRQTKTVVSARPAPVLPQHPKKQPSQQPVSAPVFKAVGFDAEVDELLGGMAVTAKSERLVWYTAQLIERTLQPLIPEAKVAGFINADLASGAAFRVAVPEVDIVICASPLALARVSGSSRHPEIRHVKDVNKLVKSTLRTCTDRLIASGHFRFRRSAFRSDEPKVTLLAASDADGGEEAMPVEISVNSATPGFNAALLLECGRIEPRAKDLALLVRRWAKDRGACQSAKGHLPPYGWTLLAIYFLQVGCDEGPLLPPVSEFEVSSTLAGPASGAPGGVAPTKTPLAASNKQKTLGKLFQEFVRFYLHRFDLEREAVAVWTGTRGSPRGPGGEASSFAPDIEDPFDREKNIGQALSECGLAHFKEELARADGLIAAGASLTELLAPWSPPEPSEPSGSVGGGDAMSRSTSAGSSSEGSRAA